MSGCIKCREFLNRLNECRVLKKGHAPCSNSGNCFVQYVIRQLRSYSRFLLVHFSVRKFVFVLGISTINACDVIATTTLFMPRVRWVACHDGMVRPQVGGGGKASRHGGLLRMY
jgi:hypothetical protein